MKREKLQLGVNHFDFFSIDLGEELSAFNGGLLRDQSTFVADCINAILKLYERSISDPKSRPTSVILLGHSMGGVVARSVFAATTYKPGTVRTILTLNSPHTSAPLLFHRGVHTFYSRVNDMWRTHCDDQYELQQTALVSIAGGLRDTQVHASLSNLDSIIPCKNHISAITTSIPDVWISMDHTSCMWCHQLTTVISSALAGLLDPNTRQAHESISIRLANLRHYFESTAPAALQLESPTPLSSPTIVLLEPVVDGSDTHDSSHNKASRDTLSSTSNDTTNVADGTQNDGEEDSAANQQPLPGSKPSWVAALPIETKKTMARVSGWHKLANFHVKWDLFQYTQLSKFQFLTTVPLDDLDVFLCDPSGVECLDLLKTAAPIPYSIKQTGPQTWQTLKAHVMVTNLKDYSLGGYRYLVVSSVHKSSQSSPNSGIYKGEYGPEIFLLAQLTDPLDIIAMNANLFADSEYHLGPNLVSHMSLLDANKYLLYHAKVERNECSTHPIFTPLILQYSPALREERYEQNHIALRFHEQFLSYNYRRTVHDATLESKNRVPMVSQEALHVFVFSDPICSYSLVLKPDWAASIDVVFRNFGVLIIGGFATLAVMVAALQQRHAEENPGKERKRVISVLAYILTSPWILLLLVLYSIPVKFADFFDSLNSPWLRNHSFSNMARPWPAPLVALILIVTSIVALTAWSVSAAVIFFATHTFPGLVKRAYQHILTHGHTTDTSPRSSSGSPVPNNGNNRANNNNSNNGTSVAHTTQHRRNTSTEVVYGYWPGAWCISQPKTALSIFILLTLVAVLLHSSITVIIALIILATPLSNDFLVSPQTESSMTHYRHAIFVLYSPALVLLIPDLLVWINNMHFEYRVFDSYERFAIFMTLHILLIKFTSPNVVLQRSALKVHWVLLLIVVFMTLYCLFPAYRATDALFFCAVSFCFDHLFKIFVTPPQERFIKAQ